MKKLALWLCEFAQKNLDTAVLSSPYFLQNFKNSGDLVCCINNRFHPVANSLLQEFLTLLKPVLPNVKLRGQ